MRGQVKELRLRSQDGKTYTCLQDIMDVMHIPVFKLLSKDLELLLVNAEGYFDVIFGCFLPAKQRHLGPINNLAHSN
jgi:hypothetical protein